MCDKMAISACILKIENDPFSRLQEELRKRLIVTNFPTNKQYVNIKLPQNETDLWSSFLVKMKYW